LLFARKREAGNRATSFRNELLQTIYERIQAGEYFHFDQDSGLDVRQDLLHDEDNGFLKGKDLLSMSRKIRAENGYPMLFAFFDGSAPTLMAVNCDILPSIAQNSEWYDPLMVLCC
jgi:hypothetical protein